MGNLASVNLLQEYMPALETSSLIYYLKFIMDSLHLMIDEKKLNMMKPEMSKSFPMMRMKSYPLFQKSSMFKFLTMRLKILQNDTIFLKIKRFLSVMEMTLRNLFTNQPAYLSFTDNHILVA